MGAGIAAKIAIKALPGVIKGIGGLFGAKGAQSRVSSAQGKYNNAMQTFEGFEFENPYAKLDNKMDNIELATQSAELEYQEQQATLAQTLDALRGGGGGTGTAAVAQAVARQQMAGQQRISAKLEQQEMQNELRSRQAAMQLQQLEAQGAMKVQGMEFDRQSTIVGMRQQELAGALEAQSENRSAMFEGLGSLALGGAASGLFGEGVKGFIDKIGE